jgi:CubicO group peptidase (beta-lactamase class C family)
MQPMSKKDSLIQFMLGFGLLALVFKAFAASSRRSNPAHGHASSGIQFDKIDAYIEGQMKRLNIPGAALAVVEGDRIVHVRGFGKSRPGGKAPLPQTPFFIGSLTKSFTAMAVMQLVEAGKVALDDPIQRHLPWFRVADPHASAQMTVRHLLNQTSGLPALAGELALFDLDTRPDATERQVRALYRLKLKHPVGTACEYSNLNYNILGLIIEAASGKSYGDTIQTQLFDPLGMKHSYVSKSAAQKNGLAVGHRHWFSLPLPAPDLPVPRGSLPSGQLISSAEDMALYLIAHLNEGRLGSVQILSAAGIAELHRGVKEYIAMGISSGKYGMGWFDTDMGKTKVFSHSGNVPDFSAHMAILPGQKRGLILLLNADPYGLPPITNEVGMGVTALLTGQEPPPIRLDFIQWIMRLLPLIPLLQLAGVTATLRQLRRWRTQPSLRPGRGRVWGEHILLPLVPNLTLAAALVYLRSSGLIRFMSLFMPDLAWIARISGTFAGIWALLRTGLILRTFRKGSCSTGLMMKASEQG